MLAYWAITLLPAPPEIRENEPEAVAEVVKHELNNTSFKWNNEYKFVPAGQRDPDMLTFEDLSKVK